MSLPDILAPGLRAVLVGTSGGGGGPHRQHYYDGRSNHFWTLLHRSGLTAELLDPSDDRRVLEYGLGLTDLRFRDGEPQLAALQRAIRRHRPLAVAFVSKAAATAYARAAGERLPRGYGPLSWDVAGRAAFVLPGSSGANNAMSVPMRAAMWRDLADFVETL